MKYLISILVVCLGASCAARKDPAPKSAALVPRTIVSAKRAPSVRTPELVKAYPVGRYTDPNYPDEMHEWHTVYRREQSPDWNYLPDPPPPVPSGSPSNHGDATGQLNAKQRAYAEALQEQNRALKKRIDSLQHEAGQVPRLEEELDRLKKRPTDNPSPSPTPTQPDQRKIEDDVFSSADPELPAWEVGVSDPGELTLFPDSDGQSQEFLFSQMRLNDQFAAQLAAAQRRKISSAISALFPRPKVPVFLNP